MGCGRTFLHAAVTMEGISVTAHQEIWTLVIPIASVGVVIAEGVMLLPIWLRLLMNNFSHIWPVLGRRLCDLRLMTIFSAFASLVFASQDSPRITQVSPVFLHRLASFIVYRNIRISPLFGARQAGVVAEIEVGVRGAGTLVQILEGPD